MSELTTIARPYAKAAFEFAVEHKAVDQWLEMLGFAAQVAENETIHSLVHGRRRTGKPVCRCLR